MKKIYFFFQRCLTLLSKLQFIIIMNFLIGLIVIIGASIILVPYILSFIFKNLLGFNVANISMKNPLCLINIILWMDIPIWGLEDLIIAIPKINIEFHLKKLKIFVKCQKLQIFIVRRLFCMEPIQLINGAQQAEILTNFNKQVDKILKEKFLNSFKIPYYISENKGQRQQGRLKIIFKAIVYFILVIILQFLQFVVQEARISFVSEIPNKSIKFKNSKQTRETLILLQCLSQYAFVFPVISLKIDIKNNQEEEFHFHCENPILQNFKRPQHNLIEGSNVNLYLTLPFTFSLEESLKKLKINIQAQYGKLTTNPQDFVEIIKLIQQILFEPGSKEQEFQNPKSQQQQQQNSLHIKINLKIQSIELILKQLYQPQYDSIQTSEYLSNISESKLCFNQISLHNMQFNIKETFLYISKIINQQQFEPVNKGSNQLSGSVLIIPNLLIFSQGKSIQIRHKEVNAVCSRQQIALLGKLFRLLNSRILREEYSWKTYETFTEPIQKYYDGQLNLLETLIEIGNEPKQKKQILIIKPGDKSKPKSKLNSFEGLLKMKKMIRYTPQNVNLLMRLNSLTHSITLCNSSYIRQSISTDMTHTLRFPKILVEHEQTKQFAITEFKLIFQQASQLQQLSIFIDDILMYQNYNTLLDYLVGFTVFKQLIQVDLTQDIQNREEGRTLQSLGKQTKKIVSITKISINYGQEKGIVKQIQIDKEVSPNGYLEHLNFSVGKCQLLVNNIVQTNKKYKYNLSDKHTIFTLSSITLKMVLVEVSNSKQQHASKSHKKLKQRTLIHIKSPSIILPEIVLAERLNSYIETIFKLEIYVEAYLLNITDDKLRMIRKKMTNLIEEPNITIIKITDINLAMQQSFFDVAMLNYGRVIRQYFSKVQRYNQIESINQLNQTKRAYKLCDIRVNSLTLQHHPIKDLQQSEKSVQQHLKNLFKQQFKPFGSSRLSKVFANYLKVSLVDLSLRIRDYPMNILKINQIGLKGQLLKTTNIYSQQRYYVHGQFQLGQIQLSIGLNLLSGIYEIYKTFNSYYEAIQKHTKTEKWINQFQETRKQQDKQVNISTKKNLLADKTILQEEVFYPYWHILHKFSTWNLSMSKSSKTKLNILTGSTPYSMQSLNLSIQSFKIQSKLQRSEFDIQKIKLMLHQHEIMTLNHLGGIFQSIYNEPRLNLIFNFYIGHKIPNHNQQNRLILSHKFIEYISKMKQLRYDWLLIYGLTASQDESIRSNKLTDRMNYLQIANIAANRTLSNSKKKLSLMSVLNTLQWKFHLTDLTLLLTNEKHTIEGLLDSFQIYVKIAADRQGQQWKLYRLRADFKNAIARIQDPIAKQQQKKQYESFFLQQFRKITQTKQDSEKEAALFVQFRNVILFCKGVKYTYRSYHLTPKRTYFVDNMFVIQQIRAQVSKQLKEVVLNLAKSLEIQKKLRIPQRNIQRAESSLQRFRRTAKYIIRINRSKKQLPNLQLVVKVKHASLSLRTDKLQMVVTTDNECNLTFNQKYYEVDKFQIDPIHEVHILFVDLQIYLQQTDFRWMLMLSKDNKIDRTRVVTARDLKLDAEVFANDQVPVYLFKDARIYENLVQRINRTSCVFRQGIVELTPQTSNLLKSIAEFVLLMTNSKGRQLQNYKIQADKYSELKTKGKANIKNKLQWNYSDLMKEQQKDGQFSFGLEKMNILFQKGKKNEVDVFMKAQSETILANMNTFSNGKREMKLEVHDLKAINCQQDMNSPFRSIIQMNEQGSLAILIQSHTYQLHPFTQTISWDFYPKLRIHFNPLKFKMTEQLYTQIDAFFFGLDKQFEMGSDEISKKNLDKYSMKLPDYYKDLLVDEVKVKIWYRTSSRIKRMEGIQIGLQKFQQKEWFVSKKELFDAWVKFVLKQLASQVFSVLGQKIFG